MQPSSIAFASPSAAPGEQDERERKRERSKADFLDVDEHGFDDDDLE